MQLSKKLVKEFFLMLSRFDINKKNLQIFNLQVLTSFDVLSVARRGIEPLFPE